LEYRFKIDFCVLDIEICTHNKPLSDLFYDPLRSDNLQNTPPLRDKTSCQCVIEIMDTPTEANIIPPPHGNPTGVIFRGGEVLHADSILYCRTLEEPGAEIEINLASNQFRLNIAPQWLEKLPGFWQTLYLPFLLNFVLPFYRLQLLHAAVVTDGRRTLFFAGDKGAGKSTTALQFMESGYQLIADDSPLFTFQDGKTFAVKSFKPANITQNTLSLFPRFSKYLDPQRMIGHKHILQTALLAEEQRILTGLFEVTDYIELRRGHFPSPRIVALDKSEILDDLILERFSTFCIPEDRVEEAESLKQYAAFRLDVLHGLVSNANAFAIEFSDEHLPELPELVAALA
jgi:hypothetical protein